MTRRALIIGIIGAVVFAAGGRYVNFYVPGPNLVRGHLPISVFGLIILFVMVINPLLGRIKASWRFKAAETAIIMALMLAVSAIIDAGLMRNFPRMCLIGVNAERTTPSMQKTHVLEYVPSFMLANDGKYSKEVVDDYMAPGDPILWPARMWSPMTWFGIEPAAVEARTTFYDSVRVSWRRVQWAAWAKPLAFWLGMLALSYAAVTGLSVMVHRQWARKERIKYPIAEIISSLLVQDQQGRTAILRNKSFWLGFGISLFLAGNKMIGLWFPDSVFISLQFDFPVLYEAFPRLMQTTGANYFAGFKIYPAAIGIAFLLASDISFGLGISNAVAVFTLFFLLQIGVETSGGGHLEGGIVPFQSFGAYMAYAIMLLYIGRKYYWQTARAAITFVPNPETDTASAWGLRVFVVCTTGLVVVLAFAGIPLDVAATGILLIMMTFFVLARMNAEAGTFFCQPSWSMSMVLLCSYGFASLGPRTYLGMTMVMYVLVAEAFECLMPYVVNGLKVTTDTGLKAGRVGMVIGMTVVVAVSTTVLLGVWSDYQNTVSLGRSGNKMAMYETAGRQIESLTLSGEFEASKNYSGLERLSRIRIDQRFLVWTAVGASLALALSAAHLRWAWWPLHPIILLTFGSQLMVGRYGASLMLGWFIKAFVVKLGGPNRYATAKPLIMGVIAGDILGGFITMLVLWGYYFVTGVKGPGWQFW
jgi:hypothetical protein